MADKGVLKIQCLLGIHVGFYHNGKYATILGKALMETILLSLLCTDLSELECGKLCI